MNNYQEHLDIQRTFYQSHVTKSYQFRLNALISLKRMIQQNIEAISEALYLDLGKSAFESYETEIGVALQECTDAIKHLRQWMKPNRQRMPLLHFPSTSKIFKEPLGVVLIIAPWNYPFQLVINPLIGALAAGNCAVLKCSEQSIHTSACIKKMFEETFASSLIKVYAGDGEESSQLLNCRFDYIFFTGSIPIGKQVMLKAARHLTPVTLELGGKSPCIIDRKMNLKRAATRIAWGKTINAGQTCIAPDYCFVHKDDLTSFTAAYKKAIESFFGQNPLLHQDFPAIINQRHFQRLSALLSQGTVVYGGKTDEKSRMISPTLMIDCPADSELLREEIFGPILPVLTYTDIEEVIRYISQREKPLALYLFTSQKATEHLIIKSLSFGGGTINDTLIHFASAKLPFGGVGSSGIGHYHGYASFLTFSHQKSVAKKSMHVELNVRYAPYKNKLNLLKRVFK